MDQLEKQLLDYEAPEGPTFTDNQLVYTARYAISAFILANIFKSFLFGAIPEYEAGMSIYFYLGKLIPTSSYILFSYYNIVQANMERRDERTYPRFRKPFIILCMFACLILSFVYTFRISTSPLIAILSIVMCAIIVRREFQYYQMVSA